MEGGGGREDHLLVLRHGSSRWTLALREIKFLVSRAPAPCRSSRERTTLPGISATRQWRTQAARPGEAPGIADQWLRLLSAHAYRGYGQAWRAAGASHPA